MSSDLRLLGSDGIVARVPLAPAPDFNRPHRPLTSRIAFAAPHVIPVAWGDNMPGGRAEIDWDETLAFRRYLWSWGLRVADAIDPERSTALDPATTRELIQRSAAEARDVRGAIVVGVSTDHLDDDVVSIERIIDAYKEQLHFSEDAGAGVVLMPSAHLIRAAATPLDYERVYREVLAAASAPVILQWTPGYFGSATVANAANTVATIIAENPDRVAGTSMSRFDADAELRARAKLPESVRMFTANELEYVRLIAGDDPGAQNDRYSDALLGVFAAIAPQASAAITALDLKDPREYRVVLEPTRALAEVIFSGAPSSHSTGIAFVSWLNGHQRAFTMIGGLHAARSLADLSRIVDLANQCGALERPELAAARWHQLLTMNGVDL